MSRVERFIRFWALSLKVWVIELWRTNLTQGHDFQQVAVMGMLEESRMQVAEIRPGASLVVQVRQRGNAHGMGFPQCICRADSSQSSHGIEHGTIFNNPHFYGKIPFSGIGSPIHASNI